MTGSSFFPQQTTRRKAPRGSSNAQQFTLHLAPEVRLTLDREAKACAVSLSAFVQRGALLLAEQTHAERESGLLAVPGRVTDEELDVMTSAARLMGLPLANWIVHTLNAEAGRVIAERKVAA